MSKVAKSRTVVITAAVLLAAAAVAAALFMRASGGEIMHINCGADSVSAEQPDARYREAFSSQGAALTYDPRSGAVAFAPLSGDDAFAPCAGLNPVMLKVTLRDKKGNAYELNSTDNSVQNDEVDIEKGKNTLKITYLMTAAAGVSLTGDEVSVRIPLVLSLDSGRIKAAVDLSDAETADGFYIEKLIIMPGLCDSCGNAAAQYIIPDGCGTVINLASVTGDGISGVLPVYGDDAVYCENPRQGAALPYYACFNGRTLLNVIIDGGDGIAEIDYAAAANGSSAWMDTVFNITPVLEANGKVSRGVSYGGEVSLLLDFENCDGFDCCTSAFMLRDFFVKKGYLCDGSAEAPGDFPFLITAPGSIDGTKNTVLTSFDEAAEMVTLLNSKGVRNVYFRYIGALDGGLSQKSVSVTGLPASLGTRDEFISLVERAKQKKCELWLEADLNAGASPIKRADGLAAGKTVYADICASAGAGAAVTPAATLKTVSGNISSLYALSHSLGDCCVCLNGITQCLCSDASAKLDRCAVIAALSEKISSLCVNSKVMLSNVCLPLMREVSFVAEVPCASSLAGTGFAEDIPLLQSVIHGSVGYAGVRIDFAQGWQGVLKNIEYGASPSFLFTYNECGDLSYGNYASQTAKYYSRVKNLKALSGMKITSYEQRLPGVYKIVYDYSRTVYVNYNKSVITVDGLLLSPFDFVLL